MKNSWKNWLSQETKKAYFQKLKSFLEKRYQETVCFPAWTEIFRAFHLTPKNSIKVVILGQDPYPNYNQADGLAFSVSKTNFLPGSLKNILKEVKNNYNYAQPLSGDLTTWAKQGVFLLNQILTVEKKKPLAHKNIGWEIFTTNVLKILNKEHSNLVFVFLGKQAQLQISLIDKNKHCILATSHPSPLGAHWGFLGSKIFLKINNFLLNQQKKPILWIK